MPPPLSARPFLMVRPEVMPTTPGWTWKMRNSGVPAAALRCTARLPAPGPVITRFLLIDSSPLVKVIAPVTEKSIVSPEVAAAIALRNEPGPLSVVVVTVIVAAIPGCTSRTASRNKKKPIRFLILSGQKKSKDRQENVIFSCHPYKQSFTSFGIRNRCSELERVAAGFGILDPVAEEFRVWRG